MRPPLDLVCRTLFTPRRVLWDILDPNRRDLSIIIVFIASALSVADQYPDLDVFMGLVIIIGSALTGVLALMLYAHMLAWVSDIFRKTDDANSIRLVLPYALIPLIIGRIAMITVTNPGTDLLLGVVSSGWSVFLLCAFLSGIRNISFLRSLAAVLMTSLILAAPLVILWFFLSSWGPYTLYNT